MNRVTSRLALLAALGATLGAAAPVLAQTVLPAPYVSRALDAVLIPINADVRRAFDLAAEDSGVLVLATEPGGTADANGILPGDVLSEVGGRAIASPEHLDAVVYWWIEQGATDFDWSIWREGGWVEVASVVTLEEFWTEIDVSTVESWSSWSSESFSYEEYYAEYSEEFSASYESSETTIEETVTSEEFAAEMASEEGAEDADGDGVADEEPVEADGDDQAEEDMGDADGDGVADDAAEEGAEDVSEEDMGGDEDMASEEDMAGEDMGGDEGGGEAAEEEPAADEGGGDEGGGGEGGE